MREQFKYTLLFIEKKRIPIKLKNDFTFRYLILISQYIVTTINGESDKAYINLLP